MTRDASQIDVVRLGLSVSALLILLPLAAFAQSEESGQSETSAQEEAAEGESPDSADVEETPQEEQAAGEEALPDTGTPALDDSPRPGASLPPPKGLDHKLVLDDLTQRADDLERRITAMAQKVLALRDSVVSGRMKPTEVVLSHRNDMGASFRLEEAVYRLDGKEIFRRDDKDGLLDAQKHFEILNGTLSAGEHLVSTELIYAGTGFGIFAYLKGYRFKVESKHKFRVVEGRQTQLTVVSYARSEASIEPKDRLAIRYDYEVDAISEPQR